MKKKEIKDIPKEPPFIIHGDVNRPKYSYPTHTHGLEKLGWPEFFINATAFGAVNNAKLINELFIHFWLNPDKMEILQNQKNIEIKPWSNDDMIICLRIVPYSFLGVRKAYNYHQLSKTDHAQVYVKGDDHVLKDSYYENIPNSDPDAECTNPMCSCSKMKWN